MQVMLANVARASRHCHISHVSRFAFSTFESRRFVSLTHSKTVMQNQQNGEPTPKKMTKRIGTHDGVFHCDEALACFLLRQLPEYESASVVRSRNPQVLEACDIVVDVGGVYDHSSYKYDHHQREFNETMNTLRSDLKKKFITRLSSAGLVYVHYGEMIIKNKFNLPNDVAKVIFEKVYEYFIQEIDAIDNGVPICDGEPKYRITTNISSRVANLNPRWNAPSAEPVESLFEKASEMVGNEFLEVLDYYATSWWPAKSIVKQSLEKRYSTHVSGKILELEDFCPWKEHLFDLEKELGIEGTTTFVIYKDKTDWRVICVPNEPNSFICRTFLKEKWRGVRDEKLSEMAEIPGCIFVHSTGFIGGNTTREGALQMAIKSLDS